MGAILGGVLQGQGGVDGEGARKRKVSSFGGHGSAAMRRPEADGFVAKQLKVALASMGGQLRGKPEQPEADPLRLRRPPGGPPRLTRTTVGLAAVSCSQ